MSGDCVCIRIAGICCVAHCRRLHLGGFILGACSAAGLLCIFGGFHFFGSGVIGDVAFFGPSSPFASFLCPLSVLEMCIVGGCNCFVQRRQWTYGIAIWGQNAVECEPNGSILIGYRGRCPCRCVSGHIVSTALSTISPVGVLVIAWAMVEIVSQFSWRTVRSFSLWMVRPQW